MRIGRRKESLNNQSGLTLVELMIAMTVLAVGLAGIMAIVVAALYGNSRNRTDTAATLLSQMVIEQMADMSASTVPAPTFQITDCAGVNWTVNTAGNPVGAGAALKGNNGATWVSNDIDFNVAAAYGAAPGNGYGMAYTACATNGSPGLIYDVRWNIMTTGGGFTKNVVVATRIRGTGATTAGGANNIYFSIPVQLKTVLGS
jgi:prepilin-type N-terminal cleavage/methylation domain-containing protein